jgi:hypothetical protein
MEEYVRGTLAFVEVVAAFPLRLVFSHMPMIVRRNIQPVEEERKMFNRVSDG